MWTKCVLLFCVSYSFPFKTALSLSKMSGTTPKRKPTIAERAMICTKKNIARNLRKRKEAALVCDSCGGLKVQVRSEVAMASSSVMVSF